MTKRTKRRATQIAYTIETVKDETAPQGVHYRVAHGASDSRVATCYSGANAQLVAAALNAFDPDGSQYP